MKPRTFGILPYLLYQVNYTQVILRIVKEIGFFQINDSRFNQGMNFNMSEHLIRLKTNFRSLKI